MMKDTRIAITRDQGVARLCKFCECYSGTAGNYYLAQEQHFVITHLIQSAVIWSALILIT